MNKKKIEKNLNTLYRTNIMNCTVPISKMEESTQQIEIIPHKKKRTKHTIDITYTIPIPDNITSKKKKFKKIEKEKKIIKTALTKIRNPRSLNKLLQSCSDDSSSEFANENNSTNSDISDITIDSSIEDKYDETFYPLNNDEQYIDVPVKQRRNALCLCGSGIKYKICCLNKSRELQNNSDDSDSVITSLSIQPDCPVKFTHRQTVTYPKESNDPKIIDEETIKWQVQSFNANYNIKLKRNRLKVAYINQRETAKNICDIFSNRQKVIQLVISRTQTGKTGCMLEFINQYINMYKIPINNIFIIANISSKDWLKQTKGRSPQDFEKQIFHLPNLNTEFRQAVEGKKNILIIVDEAHCAALKQQTLSKLMSKGGMDWNLDTMLENDIKIVQYSATPDGLIFGYKKREWPKEHYEVHIMKEGAGYYGITQMLQRTDKQVLKQAKDLNGRDKNGNWKTSTSEDEFNQNISELFDDILSFSDPKYSIIRCHGLTFDYIKDNITNYLTTLPPLISNKFNDEFRTYIEDGDISKGKLDDLLEIKPEKHTIILIKEMLKCSNTLCKTHLGVVYERCTAKEINDSFIIQGLLGRITGYDHHDIVCYTNLESIEKYEKLFKNNFDEKTLNEVQWNSNTTKVNTKGTKGKVTYIDPLQVLTKNTITRLHGIPIKIDFKTEDNHNQFVEELTEVLVKKRKNKDDNKTIHQTLLLWIKNNSITVTTHENSILHSNVQSEMSNNIYNCLNTKTLKNCRVYKKTDRKPESRRFKGWHKAYLNGKPDSAQTGNELEYSIDMCLDNWEHNGETNRKTIAWISYNQ